MSLSSGSSGSGDHVDTSNDHDNASDDHMDNSNASEHNSDDHEDNSDTSEDDSDDSEDSSDDSNKSVDYEGCERPEDYEAAMRRFLLRRPKTWATKHQRRLLTDLPEEVLSIIGGHLLPKHLHSALRVCHFLYDRWQRLMYRRLHWSFSEKHGARGSLPWGYTQPRKWMGWGGHDLAEVLKDRASALCPLVKDLALSYDMCRTCHDCRGEDSDDYGCAREWEEDRECWGKRCYNLSAPNVFQHMTNLRSLILQGNWMEVLDLLPAIPQLRILKLEVPDRSEPSDIMRNEWTAERFGEIFASLLRPGLEELSMAELRFAPPLKLQNWEALERLKGKMANSKLKTLRLDGTKLNSVHFNFLLSIGSISTVAFYDNQLNCEKDSGSYYSPFYYHSGQVYEGLCQISSSLEDLTYVKTGDGIMIEQKLRFKTLLNFTALTSLVITSATLIGQYTCPKARVPNSFPALARVELARMLPSNLESLTLVVDTFELANVDSYWNHIVKGLLREGKRLSRLQHVILWQTTRFVQNQQCNCGAKILRCKLLYEPAIEQMVEIMDSCDEIGVRLEFKTQGTIMGHWK